MGDGATDPKNPSKPPVRFLAPVDEPLDDATSPGLPVRFTPAVSVPIDEPMPPPTPIVVREPPPEDALPEAGEISGHLLRLLREKKGLSLDELSEQTKIRKQHLKAIEEQDLENLPARVWLRGFLTQIARVLKVDKHRLAEGYLAFVDRFQK